jgi:hypothetical protein
MQTKHDIERQAEMLAETGFKVEEWNGCQLWVVPNDGHIEWYMLGNTGTHRVCTEWEGGKIIWNTRVAAHWKGFVKNQNN